jgi:putative SOS response-associated peptidase YedK
MCGRYTRYLSWSEIHRLYRLTAPAEGSGRNTEARYNIAPTQSVDFITWNDDGMAFPATSCATSSIPPT